MVVRFQEAWREGRGLKGSAGRQQEDHRAHTVGIRAGRAVGRVGRVRAGLGRLGNSFFSCVTIEFLLQM